MTLRNIAVTLADSAIPFDEYPYLPMQHAAALSLVGRLMERCRGSGKGEAGRAGVPTGLYSSLKYSTKKNGVGRVAADVRKCGDLAAARKITIGEVDAVVGLCRLE